MIYGPASSQKAGDRPITFILDDRGQIAAAVTLPIRPEDLNRTEPQRSTVHQTMGRDLTGWVDHFGAGLPSVTIAGNTGWRMNRVTGADGFGSFEQLNQLVMRDFNAAKQAAIDDGVDPAGVRLLFVDVLDGFAWQVVPTQFVLRRSKSNPLLYQYNITLQAISTSIDTQEQDTPDDGTVGDGLGSIGDALGDITSGVIDGGMLDNITDIAGQVIDNAKDAVTGGLGGIVNDAVGLARDVAKAGANAIGTLFDPSKASISQITAAFTKESALRSASSVLSNALKPVASYEDYTSLFGASNGSNTTFGRPASPLAGLNAFGLMVEGGKNPVMLTSQALQAIQSLKNSDPVLAPLAKQEAQRLIGNITGGLRL